MVNKKTVDIVSVNLVYPLLTAGFSFLNRGTGPPKARFL